MTCSRLAGFCAPWLFLVTLGWAGDVYVAPNGNDQHLGGRDRPVASLERARDLLRARASEGGTVWIAGGTYLRSESFVLTAKDSGSQQAPVTYRALPGETVLLVGGQVIGSAAFEPVEGPLVQARVQETVRDKIVQLDLKKHRIMHTRAYPDKFTDNGGLIELFFDGKRMPISVYPNAYGVMTMKRVLVNGGGQEKPGDWRVYYNTGTPEQRRAMELGPPRPGIFQYNPDHQAAHERWARVLARGVWMKGYWRVVWQNETVRVAAIDPQQQTVELAQPVAHGIGNKYHRPAGSGQEIYWVMNLLEEIDRPGEWAIDFQDQMLYFYPPSPLEQADILISDMDQPVVRMDGAQHVSLQGLTIAGSLSDGIRMTDCRDCSVRGCVVRNVAKYAIVVEGGSDNEVRSCDLYALGAGGVRLSGGNSNTEPRTRANHRVINNDIHHFGEIERVYAPGVNVGFDGGGGGSKKVDAVGMVVAHNAIHHCPHAGVLFNSFDNLFEYNEVFQFALVSNDMGAFYSYAHEGGIGYETFRYNFMHSSPEGEGIYYDNITNHPTLIGNIAYKLGPPTGRGRGYGFLVKNPTGRYVDIRNNIAVNCKVGYDIVLGQTHTLANNVSVCNRQDTNHLPADHPGIHIYATDPGFKNLVELDLSLKPQARLLREMPRFKRIPFERIGLFQDEYRTTLPDYRKQLCTWRADQEKTSNYGVLDRQ